MSVLQILTATLPLLVVAVLLVAALWPATRAMPVAWASAVVVAYLVWEMPVRWILAASIEGLLVSVQILWIVFAALLLLYTMMRSGAFDVLNRNFASISDDPRVQVVLVGFFLATFLEGVAGFGTPAAVVAPLLFALGFPALAAVVVALIGHVVAVTYGAVGTPIVIGIAEPMESVSAIRTTIEAQGMTTAEFALAVARWAATYHALVGVLMPLTAVAVLVYFFGPTDERSVRPALAVWPLCLFAGVAFVVPYWLSAWLLSAEVPALIGSTVGAVAVVSTLRLGYLLPDDEWEFRSATEWPDHWVGSIRQDDAREVLAGGYEMSPARAWTPYVLLIVFLVVTRSVDSFAALLQGESVTVAGFELSLALATVTTSLGEFALGIGWFEWGSILGTSLANGVEFAYLPGTWLLLAAVVSIPLFGMSGTQVADAWGEAVSSLHAPLVALAFVLAMAHVMLHSGAHAAGVDSMIVVLATSTATLFGAAYPFFAAFIGALGAALVGSNTVSNLTFGPFQFVAAGNLGISRQLTVASQAVGGAIGNLVAIHNVVAALATVELVGEEGRVVRLTLLPLLGYLVLVGLWSLLFVYVFLPELF